jgi:hypothetical protein
MSIRTSYNHFRLFLGLHETLIKRMLYLDAAVGIAGLLFGLLPLHVLALSLENLVFLTLSIIAMVLYQIHLFRSCSAGVYFYISLPVNRLAWAGCMAIVLIIPLVAIIGVETAALFFIHPIFPFIPAASMLTQRMLYCVLMIILVKTVPLPLFILYKKHLSLIPGFFFLLTIVYFCLSMIHEFFFSWLDNPSAFMAGAFTGIVFIICVRIVASARME